MKRVLIVTPFFPPNMGGAETFAEQLVREASKWSRITVLTYISKEGKGSKKEDVRLKRRFYSVVRLKNWFSWRNQWRGTSLLNMLLAFPPLAVLSSVLCVQKKIEIVHSLGFCAALANMFTRKLIYKKHLITLLALYNFKSWGFFRKFIARFILNSCDTLFVEGVGGLRDVQCLNLKCEIKIFNHWVDRDEFFPDFKKWDKDKINILFIGRPIPEKGKHIIKEVEKKLGLRNKYKFTYVEKVEREKLSEIYQRHHICCVPSVYDEGFSRVVAEAASCGCAIITTDRGSLPEQAGEFAMICKEPYVDSFLKAIIEYDFSWNVKSMNYAETDFSIKNAEVFKKWIT